MYLCYMIYFTVNPAEKTISYICDKCFSAFPDVCTFKRTKVFQIYHKKQYFIYFECYMLKLSKSWTKRFTHKVRQRGFSIQKQIH